MVKRWAVLPMMVLGLGFELGTQAQAYEEKPTFMKALIALGLPLISYGHGLRLIDLGLDGDGLFLMRWTWA